MIWSVRSRAIRYRKWKGLYIDILGFIASSLLRQSEEDKTLRKKRGCEQGSENGAASCLQVSTQLRHQVEPAQDRQNSRFVSQSTSNPSDENQNLSPSIYKDVFLSWWLRWFAGGKLTYQTTKKRASGPKCPVTGKRIQGVSLLIHIIVLSLRCDLGFCWVYL